MAKTKETAKNADVATVVADASNQETGKKQDAGTGSNFVYVASSLLNGLVCTDLKTVKSGRFVIPSVNSRLKGSVEAGLLADGGASILVRIPADTWAEIKSLYGSMAAFTHKPPFLRELTNKSDYDNAALQSELKEVRTGAEPLTKEELAQLKTAQG